MKGALIIFSAPSGAGKTTIVRRLLKKGLNLEFSVSACSRKKRHNEVHGKDYFFLDVKKFKEKISAGEFIEWQEVYPNQYYGTLKSEVERILDKGRNVIFDMDVVGGLNLKKQYRSNSLALFVMPPSIEHLKKRLLRRSTESLVSLELRLNKASKELKEASGFDVVITNDNLEKAVKKAKKTIVDFLNNQKQS